MARVFIEYNPIYNWLTIDLIKKGLKKYKDKVIVLDTVLISGITSNTTASSELIPTAIPFPSNVRFIPPLEITAKKGGCPIGGTINLSREKEAQVELLINNITAVRDEKVTQHKGRMKNNKLDKRIREKS